MELKDVIREGDLFPDDSAEIIDLPEKPNK